MSILCLHYAASIACKIECYDKIGQAKVSGALISNDGKIFCRRCEN